MQPIKILLVEDDPGHARLIEKNLRRAGITNQIVLFTDGQSIVNHLAAPSGGQADQEYLVILLDLNLPALDGYQVLERLKTDKRTKKIPVVVLTTTDMPQEITKCYELGCNIFITKPVQYDEFCRVIHNLGLLFSIAQVPV